MVKENIVMKSACQKKVYKPWKTCDVPNPHWTNIADYGLSLMPYKRLVLSSGTYNGIDNNLITLHSKNLIPSTKTF